MRPQIVNMPITGWHKPEIENAQFIINGFIGRAALSVYKRPSYIKLQCLNEKETRRLLHIV